MRRKQPSDSKKGCLPCRSRSDSPREGEDGGLSNATHYSREQLSCSHFFDRDSLCLNHSCCVVRSTRVPSYRASCFRPLCCDGAQSPLLRSLRLTIDKNLEFVACTGIPNSRKHRKSRLLLSSLMDDTEFALFYLCITASLHHCISAPSRLWKKPSRRTHKNR